MKFNKDTILRVAAAALVAASVSAALSSCSGTDTADTKPSGGIVTTGKTDEGDKLMEVVMPSYDYLGSDLSIYVALPADILTHDYTEGLTLLGIPDDDDVEEEIKLRLKKLATQKEPTENDVVEDGDTVIMDYIGRLDGVAFSGGTANNSSHDISIENSLFIPGFDEGLLGMKAGETKDLYLTFPDPYKSAELAGKDVVFTVTIDKITKYEFPALTDKLIEDNTKFFGEKIKTAEEYRASVKKEITDNNKRNDEPQLLNAVWKYLTEKTEYKSLPDELLEKYVEAIYADAYNVAVSNKMTLEEYVQKQGYLTVEDYKKSYITESAKSYINERLVMYHACKTVGIAVSDEEVRAKAEEEFKKNIEPNIDVLGPYLGVENVDDYIEYLGGIDSLRENMMVDRLLYKLSGLEYPEQNTEKSE